MVLSVSLAQDLGPENEIWLAFGTPKHFRHLAAYEITWINEGKSTPNVSFAHGISSYIGYGKKITNTAQEMKGLVSEVL